MSGLILRGKVAVVRMKVMLTLLVMSVIGFLTASAHAQTLGPDPTSMPSGQNVLDGFNGYGWKYSLAILAIVFSIFAFVMILVLTRARRK